MANASYRELHVLLNAFSPLGSVVEHLSCKEKTRGSIPRGGIRLVLAQMVEQWIVVELATE